MIGILVEGFVAIWTPAAILAAILGGFAVGWVIEYRSPPSSPRAIGLSIASIGTLAVAVFWSGQIADNLLSGDPSWGRACGRCVIQELFFLTVAGAAAFTRARDRARS